MKNLLQHRFFQLLSKYSQCEVSTSELAEAFEELTNYLVNFSINEQDYSVLLRYFSLAINRLKSYRIQFEQEKKCIVATY